MKNTTIWNEGKSYGGFSEMTDFWMLLSQRDCAEDDLKSQV